MNAEKKPQEKIVHTFQSSQNSNAMQFVDNRPSAIHQLKIESRTSLPPIQMVGRRDFARDSQEVKEFYLQLYRSVKSIVDSIDYDVANFTDPNASHLWWSIKRHFKNEKNIDCIIGKCSSLSTGAFITEKHRRNVTNSFESTFKSIQNNETQLQRYKNSVLGVINSMNVPIKQTLEDVLYWGLQNTPKARSVNSIQLTDNDMHTRGVGVCIVEYCDSIIGGTVTKRVIKPEDKSFEAIVYGGNESLANDFNTGVLGINAHSTQVEKDQGIGILDIKTSQNHGSSVEFFEHERAENTGDKFTGGDNINIHTLNVDSFINNMIFSSLLGLADLHRENLVFGKDSTGKRKPQFIDAEIGFKYRMDSETAVGNRASPLRTVGEKGELVYLNVEGYNFDGQPRGDVIDGEYNSRQFMDTARNKFEEIKAFIYSLETKLANKRSRIVPLATPQFYALRHSVYIRENIPQETFKREYIDKLKLGSIFRSIDEGRLLNMNEISVRTHRDLLLGRIPFFEYNFQTGEYLQKFSDGTELVIYQSEDLKLSAIIAHNVMKLNDYRRTLPPVRETH